MIVVGLDGSPTSWDAFARAAGEAARGNGVLTAVYATPWVEPIAPFGVPFDCAAAEQAWQEAAEQLHDEAEQRVRGLGLHLEFVQEHGDPTQALTRVAQTAHADLIVVGQSTKMLHHLARSLGRRLLSRRDAPVIAVVPRRRPYPSGQPTARRSTGPEWNTAALAAPGCRSARFALGTMIPARGSFSEASG